MLGAVQVRPKILPAFSLGTFEFTNAAAGTKKRPEKKPARPLAKSDISKVSARQKTNVDSDAPNTPTNITFFDPNRSLILPAGTCINAYGNMYADISNPEVA